MGDGRVGFPRWVVALAGVALFGVVLYALRGVLTPVFFAFLIAYMLDPVVDRLETWRLNRSAAIVVLLTGVLGALVLFLVLVLPGVVREVAAFTRELPGTVARWITLYEPTLSEYGVPVPHSLDEALAELDVDVQDLAGSAVSPAAAAVRWVVGGTASLFGAIAGLLMIPIFAFYLLHDFDHMIAAIRDLLPWRVRPAVVEMFREVDDTLGQFVRGQISVMLILAVLYSVGYSIAGVRLAVPIGIVAGLLSFIPYVGGGLALGLALLMVAFDFHGWQQLAWVVGVYGVVQLLEGFVITPKIVGDKVGLSAVWVLFALMVGGEIFGFLGVLLAVPAAAVLKIFVLRAVRHYRDSDLFRAGAPDAPPGGAVSPGSPAGDESPAAPASAGEPPPALEEADEDTPEPEAQPAGCAAPEPRPEPWPEEPEPGPAERGAAEDDVEVPAPPEPGEPAGEADGEDERA